MNPSSPSSIVLENISKEYRIPKFGKGTVLGSVAIAWDAFLGRSGKRHAMFRHFKALKPLSLDIGKGEAIAIVGRNGSGKSTLLEIIAGTLQPTTGSVTVNGSLSALLQLGSGFNPDFTGLENVYLNGSMMGLSRDRLDEKLDDILEFADIGDFVEQPVRTYSTGMRLRLAFAVITAVDPDILIIDEALSVGDTFFQARCARWLEDFVSREKTFLCVSHDMFMIKRLCSRGIVIDEGNVICDGDVAETANIYYRLHRKKPIIQRAVNKDLESTDDNASGENAAGSGRAKWKPVQLDIKERTGDGRITIESIMTSPDLAGGLTVGDWLKVQVEVLCHEPVEEFHIGFGFRDRSGQLIGGYHSFYTDEKFSMEKAGAGGVIQFEVKIDLKPQLYLLVVGLAINHTVDDWYDLDCIWDCAKVAVDGSEPFWGLTKVLSRNSKMEPKAD